MVNYLFLDSGNMIYGFFMSLLFIMIPVRAYFAFKAFYISKLNYNLNKCKNSRIKQGKGLRRN